MVTQIWRRRRAEARPEETPPAGPPAETTEPAGPAGPAEPGTPGGPARPRRIVTRRRPVEAVPQTVLVDRRTARRWRGARKHNLVSATIWLAAWIAAAILLLGILLTWANANPANDIMSPVLRAAEWLGSPFRDAFMNPDPEHRLYASWGLAAGVYLVIGRVLSWLTRW
jgi:hypothetical protein